MYRWSAVTIKDTPDKYLPRLKAGGRASPVRYLSSSILISSVRTRSR